MLKDRQDGLVCLHGGALLLAGVGIFFAWAAAAEASGLITFVKGLNLAPYVLGVVVAFVWMQHGLHGVRNRLGNLEWREAARLTRQQITRIMVLLFTLAFATRDLEVSRAFLMSYVFVMGGVLMIANRLFPRLIVRWFFRTSSLRTVLVASPEEVADVSGWLGLRRHFGIELVGWISRGQSAQEEPVEGEPPRLGSLRSLRRVLLEHDVSQVVVSQWAFTPEEARTIACCAEELGCRVRFYANLRHHFGNLPISIEHDADYTFVTLTAEPLDNPVNRMLKRLLDIAVALPVLLFVLPILTLVIWAVQRRQSPGPVFHRQYRSGINRRKFLIYKFRTMHEQSRLNDLTQQARRNDDRIYPFGRVLRRTSLDEIPQFLNVLFGDMSVSGPRPHLLEHDEQFAKVVSSYYTRHFVKPGITGLAQSKGFRGEISEVRLLKKRIGYDMIYIRRWTLILDLQILVNTVWQVMFPPRTAY